MPHKASIVLFLFLHALQFGLNVKGEVISSRINHAGIELQMETAFCPEEVVNGDVHGWFVFPKTEVDTIGVVVKVDCPYGFRDDGYQSFYNNNQIRSLEIKKAISGAIRTCILDKSEDGKSRGKWMPPVDKTVISYCKEDGWERVLYLFKVLVQTMNTNKFKQLRPRAQELLEYAYKDHECALELINGIDSVLRNPALGPDTISKEERDHVMVLVDDFKDNIVKFLPPGQKTQVGDGGIVVETAKLDGMSRFLRTAKVGDAPFTNYGLEPYLTNFATLESSDVGIGISSEALHMSMDSLGGAVSYPSLKITAYSEDVFKAWNEQSTTNQKMLNLQLPDESNFDETVSENCENAEDCSHTYSSWGLLTIELDGQIQNLTEQIEFVISNGALMEGHKMTCVYWDSEVERWSTEGLTTIELKDGVKCKSTHLTAFSALIEPLPLPFPGAEYAPINNSVHSFILSILSSIGSICSIVGLSFTLLTYGLFRSLRRERSNRILINLSSSLLLMHIMSISGSKSLWDGRCFVPAASLHYLVLTSLAWMMVEAVHMFELLISVFVRPENRFLIKRIVLAWGIPLIIVGICTAVDPKMYTIGRADLCLMNAHVNIVLYYTAYIGPICIMLLVNIIIFGRVFRVLYKQTRRTNNGATNKHGTPPKYQFVKISPSQIKGATTVLVLLGIGWTLGLLAIGPFEVLFRYLFCICNAGQGLFIFIFRVLLNPHASKQWKRVILGLSPDSSLDTSYTTSTTTGMGKGAKRRSDTISPAFISASSSVENSLTPSNPLSATLATTLASILRSEDARAAGSVIEDNN